MATLLVPATWNGLQQAVDAANPGDELVCDPSVTFAPLMLRKKSASGRILIRTSAQGLVADGSRIDPSAVNLLPTIVAAWDGLAALMTEPGAHDYQLLGLQFRTNQPADPCDTLVTLGDGSSAQTSQDQLPQNIVLDRCLLTAWPQQTLKRGVGLNCGAATLQGCHVAGFKSAGQDSQAAAGWNGPGPFKILNCYLEAAGENVIFGGAAGGLSGCVPSNIEIRGNTFRKPLSWNPLDPSFAGTTWSIKNLLELKNAQDVLIADNDFANSWLGSQTGFAILLTPRGDQSGGSYAQCRNVRIRGNRIANCAQGLAILGSDDASISGRVAGLVIENNVLTAIGGAALGGNNLGGVPRLLQVTPGQAGGVVDMVFRHNTIKTDGCTLMVLDPGHDFLEFTDNIVPAGTYGIMCQGVPGEAGLQKAFGRYKFLGNVVVGVAASAGGVGAWPVGNRYVPGWSAVGLKEDPSALDITSPYKGQATDGTDPGANLLVPTPSLPPKPPDPPLPLPGQVATTTTITAPAWMKPGDKQTLTVAVQAADGSLVQGPIKLRFQGPRPGEVVHPQLSNGQSSFNLVSLPAGDWTLTADFLGSAQWTASTSAPVSIKVSATPPPPPPPPPPATKQFTVIVPAGLSLDQGGTFILQKQA